jgi:electron transfer flavoprotein alpha subunit
MLGTGKLIADKLGEELSAVVVGQDIGACPEALAEGGASKVYLIESAALATYTTDGYAKAMAELISQEKPSLVLIAHNSLGKDLAPALAQKLKAGQVSDVIGIELENGVRFKRPIYAGKAYAFVSFTAAATTGVVTIRPKAFTPAERKAGASTQTVAFATSVSAADIRQIVKDVVSKASGRVELTEADVVVSGGRGMKSGENFKILEALADVLGAAVGATRAAVDEGWIETQFQVGQTGKVVSPTLYIACGISGAIQHLAGMSSSKFIVAINKDPEAEIFKVADYGIVADLFDVVPVLTREFKSVLAER